MSRLFHLVITSFFGKYFFCFHIHVFVTSSVKSIAPQMMFPVQLIRDGVAVRVFRNHRVVGRVEDGDLFQGWEELLQDPDAFQAVGVVQGCKDGAFLDPGLDVVRDDLGALEHMASMDDSVADPDQLVGQILDVLGNNLRHIYMSCLRSQLGEKREKSIFRRSLSSGNFLFAKLPPLSLKQIKVL